jgi:hypothetical protein
VLRGAAVRRRCFQPLALPCLDGADGLPHGCVARLLLHRLLEADQRRAAQPLPGVVVRQELQELRVPAGSARLLLH